MITENASKVWRIYQRYGRGSLSWDDGLAELAKLGIATHVAGKVLLGKYPIAGH